MTGADVKKNAERVEMATETARVHKELMIAIEDSKTKVVAIGWKPTLDNNDYESAKEFLKNVMDKSEDEIRQIGLVSASFSRLDSSWPTGVLMFTNEKSAIALLRNKKKAKAKNIKLKSDIPMAYKEVDKKWRQTQYRRFQKGFVSKIEFEGIDYVTSYKKKDNGANNEYYNWFEEDRFTPTSIRVKGNGLETNRIATPADVLDSVLIELKTAKASIEELEACIKTLLDGQLDGITIELNVQNTSTALIKSSSEHIGAVNKLCDNSILVSQGATIVII